MTATIRALLLPLDGEPRHVHITGDWRAVAAAIDCQWVERVTTPLVGADMWVDESGLIAGKPHNPWTAGLHPGPIAGAALVTGQQMTWEGPDIGDLDATLDAAILRLVLRRKHTNHS